MKLQIFCAKKMGDKRKKNSTTVLREIKNTKIVVARAYSILSTAKRKKLCTAHYIGYAI